LGARSIDFARSLDHQPQRVEAEAGMDMRFQAFDRASAPRPVWLKAGGAVSLLLVKFSRSFEAACTDFKRVEPYEEPAAPMPELPVLLK
jgi:hypothetical protein